MVKKPAATTPRAPRTKKSDAKPEGDLKPIGEAMKDAGLVADGKKPADPAAGRTQPEYAMDKLAGEQRKPPPDRGDPLDPIVIRGANVDTVNGFKTTNKDQLQKLAKRYKSMKEDAQGKAGEISTMLQKAEETQNLDTWAFKEAMKWKKMSDDKKVRRLPIFMKYLDDLGVVDDATAQGDLLAETAEKDQLDVEDAAAKAATGLAPGRKTSGLSIVPKDQPKAEPTAETVFKPLH